MRIVESLERITELRREGWWSGETLVHRPLSDVELLMRAEDLHVAVVTTWWNDRDLWTDGDPPQQTIVRFDGDRMYDLLGGEDERGGGALLYSGLQVPLPIAGSKREWPASLKFWRKGSRPGRGSTRKSLSGGTSHSGSARASWTPWALPTITCTAAAGSQGNRMLNR